MLPEIKKIKELSIFTPTEIVKTEELAKIVKKNFIENYASPFEFGYEK